MSGLTQRPPLVTAALVTNPAFAVQVPLTASARPNHLQALTAFLERIFLCSRASEIAARLARDLDDRGLGTVDALPLLLQHDHASIMEDLCNNDADLRRPGAVFKAQFVNAIKSLVAQQQKDEHALAHEEKKRKRDAAAASGGVLLTAPQTTSVQSHVPDIVARLQSHFDEINASDLLSHFVSGSPAALVDGVLAVNDKDGVRVLTVICPVPHTANSKCGAKLALPLNSTKGTLKIKFYTLDQHLRKQHCASPAKSRSSTAGRTAAPSSSEDSGTAANAAATAAASSSSSSTPQPKRKHRRTEQHPPPGSQSPSASASPAPTSSASQRRLVFHDVTPDVVCLGPPPQRTSSTSGPRASTATTQPSPTAAAVANTSAAPPPSSAATTSAAPSSSFTAPIDPGAPPRL